MNNIANSGAELDFFLQKTFKSYHFELAEINFQEQSDWRYHHGALSHKSSGFFDIIGLIDNEKKEHLMLFQPQSALTGLVICIKNNICYVLLQARIEPGNSGVVQYGPTIQSTPANYLTLHGGKETSVLNLFYSYSNKVVPLSSSMQLDIGGRYFQKSKWHKYVLANDLFNTEKHMIWASLNAIEECIGKSNFLNTDLRSLLAVFDWNKLSTAHHSSNKKDLKIIEKLWTLRSTWKYAHQFTPIETLKNWKIDEKGINAIQQHRVAIKFFKTTCDTREVRTWVQPLITVESKGLSILILRKLGEEIQCVLTIKNEIGIDGGYSVSTSYMTNPGEPFNEFNIKNGKTLIEYIQSDEGGRFYKNETVNRVILIDTDIVLNDHQFWVSLSDLKNILSMSNVASIELRCISSIFFKQLNTLSSTLIIN